MKKIIIAVSILPTLAFAITDVQKDAVMQANIQALEQKGLPTPDSGVQPVPATSIKLSDWMQKKFADERKEMKTKGYVERSSMRAEELIHIQKQIKNAQLQETGMHKGTDSHLRKKADEIPFAYSYIGVPMDSITEFYGIAPSGTYVKEPQSGWSGAVAFFKSTFANCAYTENNMRVSHGAARIAEEDAQYDVNSKITLIDIEGNESTGYLYRVNWFDNIFNHNLECATKDFSEKNRVATINLAKSIDRQI